MRKPDELQRLISTLLRIAEAFELLGEHEPPTDNLLSRAWRTYWKIERRGSVVVVLAIPFVAAGVWLGDELFAGLHWLIGLLRH